MLVPRSFVLTFKTLLQSEKENLEEQIPKYRLEQEEHEDV
jgi:hypothetical protein